MDHSQGYKYIEGATKGPVCPLTPDCDPYTHDGGGGAEMCMLGGGRGREGVCVGVCMGGEKV